jgi:hypothetical protein
MLSNYACFPMSQVLLCWINYQFVIVAREAKGPFSVQGNDKLYNASRNLHLKYNTLADFKHELLLRSTGILFPLERAVTVSRTFPVPHSAPDGTIPAGPAWPHTHTLDLGSDDIWAAVKRPHTRAAFAWAHGRLA